MSIPQQVGEQPDVIHNGWGRQEFFQKSYANDIYSGNTQLSAVEKAFGTTTPGGSLVLL
jgi:hypothetical protein